MRKIFSILFILFFCTCGKKVTKINSDYVGNWHGWDGCCDQWIGITDSNKGSYDCSGGEDCKKDHIKGTARLTDKALMIGIRKFIVKAVPTSIKDTVWDNDTLNMRMKIKIAHWFTCSGDIVTFYKRKK